MTTRHALLYLETRLHLYRRTWRGSVASSFLNPVMFLAAMGVGLGSFIDRGGAASLGGVDYLAFLAPGLMAAATMQSATGDATWPVMASIKWLKTYQATLATPISVSELLVGHLAAIWLRMGAVAFVYGLIAAAFGAMGVGGALAASVPASLTGLAFAALATAFTASLNRETGLVNLYRFGIVPMFLLSGTFFPITQLPGWLQPVAAISPLWHGVELTRSIALSTPPAWPFPVHLGVLVGLTAVGGWLSVRFLARRLVA